MSSASPSRPPARAEAPGCRGRPRRSRGVARGTLDGVFVTGTGTEVGKTVVAAAMARSVAATGARVAVFKPAVSGLEEGGEPDHALLRRAVRVRPIGRRDRSLPLRAAGLATPRRGAGRRGDRPRRPRRRGSGRRRGRRLPRLRGGRRAARPSDARLPGARLRPRAGNADRDRRRPGLGTINHTLLTVEATRAVGLEARLVVLTPWPDDPGAVERSNRSAIERLGEIPTEVLGRLDLRATDSWPSLPPPGA